MLRTFNSGIGLVAIAAHDKADAVIAAFMQAGETAMRIGTLIAGEGEPKVRTLGALKL